MAQVRAVRRPYSSRRGRVNDSHTEAVEGAESSSPPPAPESNVPTVTTVELPPLPEPGAHRLPDASDEEREAPGTGEPMEAIEATPGDTETELTATEIEADTQAEAARAESNVDYSEWTVSKLAAELKRRELPSSGSKPELVARLLESDVDAGL